MTAPLSADPTTLPLVAIVGRPNVGKSTLLNRILGRREAIVEERPGVTRDRKVVEVEWAGRSFLAADTGGWAIHGDTLDAKVTEKAEETIGDADAIIVVVDVTTGVTEEDARVAELARRTGRPVFLAVNKVDDVAREPLIWDFTSLGIGDPFPVSALHGTGAADLLDQLVEALPEVAADDVAAATDADHWLGELADEKVYGIALVGRPNVGKSTLFNRLIGEDRSVVHDVAGTTRDTIDTVVDTEYGSLRFIDTAGMRRKAKVDDGTEYYSVLRALRAIDDADVALLVVDSTIGVTHQDQRLAERIHGAGCPVVVVLNKWDLLVEEQQDRLLRGVGERLHFLGESPVLRVSALTGRGVAKLLPAVDHALDGYQTRIPTVDVNRVLRAAQAATPAPAGARVLYATQGATHPPTFTLFANKTIPPTYLRYLERSIREAFGLDSTPIKLRVRRRDR